MSIHRNAHRLRRVLAGCTLLVVAATVLTGCRRRETTHAAVGAGGTDPDHGGSGACAQAGALTGAVLPSLERGAFVVEDPRRTLVELVDQVVGLIPAHPGIDVDEFVGADRCADRLSQLNDVVECGYETDRLAVRIFQSRQDGWAVGVAAVIRGRLGAVADVAACFLLKQIPLFGLITPGQGILPSQDQPAFCFDTGRDKRDDEDYTVMWIGSSVNVCAALQDQLVPGQGRRSGQRQPGRRPARGPVAERPDLGVPAGTMGRVTCHLTGQPVGGDDVWARTEVLGSTGYISAHYLTSDLALGDTDACQESWINLQPDVSPAGPTA